MKKELLALFLVTVCCTANMNVATAATQKNTPQQRTSNKKGKTVIFGKSADTVALGMTKEDVLSVMPYHYGERKHSYGVEELIILYKTESQNPATMDVLFMNGKVVQIATNDLRYRIPNGEKAFQSLAAIRNGLRNLVKKDYYFSTDKTVRKIEFYDEVSLGASFVFIPNEKNKNTGISIADYGIGNLSVSPIPDYIIVHNPGRPVIGILKGIRGEATIPKGYSTEKSKSTTIKLDKTQRHKAENALRALRALQSALPVSTYYDFSSRLGDTKIVVDDCIASLPDGNLKEEFKSAITAYTMTQQWWKQSITSEGIGSDLNAGFAKNASDSAAKHISVIEEMLKLSKQK